MKSGMGTGLYSAPEQLTNTNYDNKVDMYSFGILIFELFSPKFNTEMEKYKIMNDIKNKIIPDYVPKEYHDIINSLLDIDSTKRYNCNQLMKLL